MSGLAMVVTGMGVALLVVSAAGLFRLPDALSRQHAATKSITLALGLVLVGVALHSWDPGVTWRVTVLMAILLLTSPVASHMLARAAARHAYTDDELSDAPRLELPDEPQVDAHPRQRAGDDTSTSPAAGPPLT
ncbi:MAG: monovalent cation/H(+) antiporter subunit G [Polyangiaceae bacterium]|nr:monovalent cation/H(+) antiporter subunit G [Polyangiaceae bacterium]